MTWRRTAAVGLVLLMLLSACATGEDSGTSAPPVADTPTTRPAEPAGSGESTTSTQGETATPTEGDTSPTAAPPQIEGPAAPDFTFALADGSNFVLSEEQKPVYLVFWAEW